MRKTFASLLVSLAVAASAFADHKIIGDRDVPAHSFTELSVADTRGVVWFVAPAPVKQATCDGKFFLAGVPGREYQVTALVVVVDFEARTFSVDSATATIRFGVQPGPQPPDPGPDPPPNPPIDPLAGQIKAAATADGWGKTELVKLADGLRAADAVSKSRAAWTVAELATAFQGAIRNAVGGPTPATLRKVLGDQLNAALPTDPTHTMTATELGTARDVLTRLASACQEAAK